MKNRIIYLLVITVSLLLGVYWYVFKFTNNFYVVVPNKIYRSSQPTLTAIQDWQSKYGIKTILNLRGENFYQENSIAATVKTYAKNHNIAINSIELKSSRVLTQMELLNIINILDNVPKPLLVHCKNGVDRTGLVSAIARILDNQSLETAWQEFTWTKGFMPNREAGILKILIEDYQKWLVDNNLVSNREYFVKWAKKHYIPYYYRAKIELVEPMHTISTYQPQAIKIKVTNISNHAIPFTTDPDSGIVATWCYYSKQQARQRGWDCRYLAKIFPVTIDGFDADAGNSKEIEHHLQPKESLILDIVISPVRHPGKYTLELELMEKGKFKFSTYGNKISIADFEII